MKLYILKKIKIKVYFDAQLSESNFDKKNLHFNSCKTLVNSIEKLSWLLEIRLNIFLIGSKCCRRDL